MDRKLRRENWKKLNQKKDCAGHNIETRQNLDFMKNNPENTDLQGENMVFLGTVSKLTVVFHIEFSIL